MAIQHNQLTGADLHEPKGASTAAINTVYVSDGAGSGSWTTYNTYRTTKIVKTSATARTSTTTFAADPALTFAVSASSTYLIKGMLFVTASATPDFKVRLTGPASSTWRGEIFGRAAGVATIEGDEIDESGDSFVIAGGSPTELCCWFEVYLVTTGSGTFSVEWAQNSSSASATTMQAGSYIEYQKIA